MKINQLDLFSGIGGFHLGFHQAGYKVNSHFSEIDKHAIAVYQNQFKDATYSGSVDTIRQQQLPNIDLITFGSPCQDFSLAGKRKGIEGERSSLISEAIRLITETEPDIFIWENVKGVFSSNNGADFIAIIQAFTNIGNYRLEWELLNTAWVLPQNRERVYLIGHHRRTSRGMVFPFKEGSFESVIRSSRQGIGKGINVVSATKSGHETANIGDSVNLSQLTSKTRRGRVGKQKAQTLETSCNQVVYCAASRGRITGDKTERGSVWVQQLEINKDSKSNALSSVHKDNILIVPNCNSVKASLFPDRNTNANGRRTKNEGEPAFTISSTVDAGITVDGLLRRFTETECERLQGFEDSWTAIGDYSDTEDSDRTTRPISRTQRYKMLGNAVTVDIVELIGKRLLKSN